MTHTLSHTIKRVAMLAFVGAMAATGLQAQEALHLFYKNGTHEKIAITEDSQVEFSKHPSMEIYYDGMVNDTIHLSANAGRTHGYGMVMANVSWMVSTDASWLTVRYDKLEKYKMPYGDGVKQTICLIFAEANKTGEERTATITFTPKQGEAKTLTVVQHPSMLSLDIVGDVAGFEPVTSKEETIAWNATKYYVYVFPNFDVKVLSKPSWMTLEQVAYGDDGFTLEKVAQVSDEVRVTHENINSNVTSAYFTFEENRTSANRTGDIIFELNGETVVINVTQEGLNEEAILPKVNALHKRMYMLGNLSGMQTHVDFGYPSLMLAMDSRGIDLVSDDSDYNHFSKPMQYTDFNDYVFPQVYWNFMYGIIKAANEVMKEYEGVSEVAPVQFYLAHAHALRAFNYFYLAQLYQQTYVGNENKLCVPLIHEGNMDEVDMQGCPRASVSEVYEFILKDLDEALVLLEKAGMERPGKQYVNSEVIYALRARIYMVMNRWEDAAADAKRVIDSGTSAPYDRDEVSRPSFDDINHKAWIWGIDTEEDDHVVTSGVVNWPSFMGSLNYGYAQIGIWRKVNRSLYIAIPATDVRKGWFLDCHRTSENLTTEQLGYVNSNGIPAYTQMKFAPYKDVLGTDVNANDIPLIRVEEMYLILAEAKAMMKRTTEAADVLNNFVKKYRDPAYDCNASTVEELVEAVWMQRRIELWGEGHSYFDLMRLKKGVDRRGAGFQPDYVFNIPAGDDVLIYSIPDSEMNRNPQLVQNPTAQVPESVEDVMRSVVGVGTYAHQYLLTDTQEGLTLYNELGEDTYIIKDWGLGVDFTFTWDGGTTVKVHEQSSGYIDSQYGEIYVMEINDYAGQEIASSYYDPETKTFYFAVIYYIAAGYFGYGYETFTLTDGQAAPSVRKVRNIKSKELNELRVKSEKLSN